MASSKMEEMRTVAMALYNNGSSKSQAAVQDFFKSMDTDRSGSISKKEFQRFLEKKFPGLFNREFFSLFDEDGNDSLDFEEVLVFFYFTNYRGVFCHGAGCRTALFGLYFTCVCCFMDQSCQKRYDLCLSCFQRKNHAHEHTQFLDNYGMLNVVKNDADEENANEEDAGEEDANEEDAGEEDANEEDAGEEDAGEEDANEEDAGTTNTGDPKRRRKRRWMKKVGKEFVGEIAILAGGSIATGAVATGACTIM